jgi:hypothetical protein
MREAGNPLPTLLVQRPDEILSLMPHRSSTIPPTAPQANGWNGVDGADQPQVERAGSPLNLF